MAAYGPTGMLEWSEYISVAVVTADIGSALTAAHFWKGPKVSKRPLPHHSAPRSGSVCPNTGLNPWAAVLPGYPRIQACVRPVWFDGALKIKSKIKIKNAAGAAL
ncbi:hypothetical protein CYL20_00780 [Pseudomonas palleroniana]|uniref:Uncharacterized protein n=1 Tax=Pseudomonas palleroniana TaxID=191390 RepID=A0A2L1J3U4_9PSED|nr:hypothetical protein CYL20_00780 [Pseudomonas palleroniana]